MRPGGISAPSRIAETGETRVARSAGPRPASTVTMMPTASETTIVRAPKTVLVDGSVDARRREHAADQLGEAEARHQADHGGDRADRQRLGDDRAQHLAPGGAERPQQRELTRALRDRDRERVVDGERAHDDGDAAEHEQEDLQELHERLEPVEREAVVRGRGLDLHGVPAATSRLRADRVGPAHEDLGVTDRACRTATARRGGRTGRTSPSRSSRRRRTWRCR